MKTRKKTCYFPQVNSKPFAVHHTDYGIFSEIRITNVGGEAEVVGVIINDEFQPSVEIGDKEWFMPLGFPKRLRFGASFAVALQGPAHYMKAEQCFKGYPRKVLVKLSEGSWVSFGLWDIVRVKKG